MPVASIQELGTVNWESGGFLHAHRDSPTVPAFMPYNNGSGNRISSSFLQLPNSENFVHFGTIEALVSHRLPYISNFLMISITQQAGEIVATLVLNKLLKNRPFQWVILTTSEGSEKC